MVSETDVNMDSCLAGVALRSGLLANKISDEAKHESLLDELNRYRKETEQLLELNL